MKVESVMIKQRVESLVASDDLETIIGECADQGWIYIPQAKKLRIAFQNFDGSVLRTVRVGSLKGISQRLKENLNTAYGILLY